MSRLALFALGNVLQGDDGVGPFALDFLMSRWVVPDDVTVCDLGTPGIGLGEHFLGFERVVLLDAFRGEPAGGLARWEPGTSALPPPTGMRHSHDSCLGDALAMAALNDPPTRVVVLGVHVAEPTFGIGLSRAARLAVPALAEQAVDELIGAGVAVARRPEPLPLRVWWRSEEPLTRRSTPAGPASAAPGRTWPTAL